MRFSKRLRWNVNVIAMRIHLSMERNEEQLMYTVQSIFNANEMTIIG